ncbi:hypothetical protein VNO77_27876 [Canavalia gladiata]|uniref:Uncharacterized protein n=1 Tax=Canavalia gladiata TaxID=3824 RepID=A0AAN9KY39_CANGL
MNSQRESIQLLPFRGMYGVDPCKIKRLFSLMSIPKETVNVIHENKILLSGKPIILHCLWKWANPGLGATCHCSVFTTLILSIAQ